MINIPANKQYQLVTIGSAIVDIQANIADSQLNAMDLPKGGMVLIDEKTAEFYKNIIDFSMVHSGGSASNTAAGFAGLGGKASFIGRIGRDELGQIFSDDMRNTNIDICLAQDDTYATSSCYIMVSDDGERTMATLLSAASQFSVADITKNAEYYLNNSAILYIEGYLYDTPSMQEALLHAIKIAKNAGALIAFSLSDSFCVSRHLDAFKDLISSSCDMIFCNIDEACQLTNSTSIEDVKNILPQLCHTSFVTAGADGAWCLTSDGTYIHQQASNVAEVVDTTGAGDHYAAGVLYGITHGSSLAEASRLGCQCAGDIIQHYGARQKK